jgi:hypothetical protein
MSSVEAKLNEMDFYLKSLSPAQVETARVALKTLTHSLVLFSGEKHTQNSYAEFLNSFNGIFDICRLFTTIIERHDKKTFDGETLSPEYEGTAYNDKIIDNYLYIYNLVEEINRALLKLRQSMFKDIENHKQTENPDEVIAKLLEHITNKYSRDDEDKYKFYRLFLENIRNEILL